MKTKLKSAVLITATIITSLSWASVVVGCSNSKSSGEENSSTTETSSTENNAKDTPQIEEVGYSEPEYLGNYQEFPKESQITNALKQYNATQISQNPIESTEQAKKFNKLVKDRFYQYLLLPQSITLGNDAVEERKITDLHELIGTDGDPMKFYHLDNKYDTPLKVKAFKESEEYKALLTKFSQSKSNLETQNFFVVLPVVSKKIGDRTAKNLNYNVDKDCFQISYPINYSAYNTTGLGDYDLSFKLQLPNKPQYKRCITTKAIPAEVASMIEDNRCDLVIVGNISGVVIDNKNPKLEFKGEENKTAKQLYFNPKEFYFVNRKTGEIYYQYSEE